MREQGWLLRVSCRVLQIVPPSVNTHQAFGASGPVGAGAVS
jgi:hypothetical protein